MSINPSNLSLLNMRYSGESGELNYEFLSNGERHSFVVKAINSGGIRGIDLTEAFELFIQPFLAQNHLIPKMLSRLTWDYIEGKQIELPAKFI